MCLLLCQCDQMPSRDNLTEERLILAHSFRGSGRGWRGRRRERRGKQEKEAKEDGEEEVEGRDEWGGEGKEGRKKEERGILEPCIPRLPNTHPHLGYHCPYPSTKHILALTLYFQAFSKDPGGTSDQVGGGGQLGFH